MLYIWFKTFMMLICSLIFVFGVIAGATFNVYCYNRSICLGVIITIILIALFSLAATILSYIY